MSPITPEETIKNKENEIQPIEIKPNSKEEKKSENNDSINHYSKIKGKENIEETQKKKHDNSVITSFMSNAEICEPKEFNITHWIELQNILKSNYFIILNGTL